MFNPNKYINFALLKDFVANVSDSRLQSLFLCVVGQTVTNKQIIIPFEKLTELGIKDPARDLSPLCRFFIIKEDLHGIKFIWQKERKDKKAPAAVNISNQLRAMDWPDVITYFTTLPSKEAFSPHDLCDYFHFRFLDAGRINKWTVPNYKRCYASSEKLLSLYGKEFSVSIIDILFRKYNILMDRPFESIHWGMGLLSSDKMGWLLEKIIRIYVQENDNRNEVVVLLRKPRALWSYEETKKFLSLISGEQLNGEETEREGSRAAGSPRSQDVAKAS